MAGRSPIEPSYIVDLYKVAQDIIDNESMLGKDISVVIPVYENNFNKYVAEKLIFLTYRGIYQSIRSQFVEAISIIHNGSAFLFKDKFENGNECGYKFGTMELTHPDAEPLMLSYYYR